MILFFYNMVNIQTNFMKFHDAIKVDFDESQLLREKRDLIVRHLKDGLKRLFSTNAPTFECFNQGSYALATGVEPLSGDDFDIDVGIVFNFSKNNYKPVEVKKWVYHALNTGNRTVEIKRPCVRVQYHENGEKLFHVDLAIYSRYEGYLGQTIYHIAKGFPNSSEDKKIWEISEPFKLKELLNSRFTEQSDREQFRRIIRYLKRWKDIKFSSTVSGKPTGIALTACCYNLFIPQKDFNYNSYTYQYNDFRALYNVVDGIINMFNCNNTINVQLPVQPHNNLFEKMTDIQMTFMQLAFWDLGEALRSASNQESSLDACIELQKVFGKDFPLI